MKLHEFLKQLKKPFKIETDQYGTIVRIDEICKIPIELNGQTISIDASGESVIQFDKENNLTYANIFDKEQSQKDAINCVQTMNAQGLIGEHEEAMFHVVSNILERKKIC